MDVMSAMAWLADAPLFIDNDQIARLHDAVLEPTSKEGTTTISLDEESINKLHGKFGASAELSPGGLGHLLASLFNFKASINTEAGGEAQTTTGKTFTFELHPIDTPQRQLVQIATHYLANYGDRLAIVDTPSAVEWRKPANILLPPRSLAFIDVPNESHILPLAIEFANGEIVRLFEGYKGEGGAQRPKYPKKPELNDRQNRWKWFADNVTPADAMEAIEDAAKRKGRGRIQWIDYRVMLDAEGNTLHLHVVPVTKYDTGTFAYNLVKRGNRHGLRLVGTLKSGPSMNVLAVYEK